MELPLRLRRLKDGRLLYAISLWYRLLMLVIFAIVLAAVLSAGEAPGLFAWIVLALVGLGGLYEERWSFDPERASVSHRMGLLVAARTLTVPFDAIERFRLVPHVRGTIPGSADERVQNEAAMRASRGDDLTHRRAIFKKPYVGLLFECGDGTHYLIDSMNARRSPQLRADAQRIASLCGKPLEEG